MPTTITASVQPPVIRVAFNHNGDPAGFMDVTPPPVTVDKTISDSAANWTAVGTWTAGEDTADITEGGSGNGGGSASGAGSGSGGG